MSWSGIILIVVGALLLANNFDLLSLGWLRQWWPAILMILGAIGLVWIAVHAYGTRQRATARPASRGGPASPAPASR